MAPLHSLRTFGPPRFFARLHRAKAEGRGRALGGIAPR